MSLFKRIGLVLCALLVGADPAFAQFTTGSLFGKVVDEASGSPVSGVTVIATGPQGDQAALTEADGSYQLAALPLGEYVVQFFAPDATESVNVMGVVVAAGQTVRVDGMINAQVAPSETMVITRRAPSVDLGTSRTGLTLQGETMMNLPLDRTFGGVLSLAPGAFFDASGNVSVMGASGLENVYMIDGLNVTGIEYGSIMSTRDPKSRGGTNLVLEFLDEVSINTGGYAAEYGGAMGGVVNAVTKSGTNEFKGSVFGMWTPSGLYGSPIYESRSNSSLSGRSEFGNELNFGFEVGGPIIKNRLFFWAGFAPRLESSDFRRNVNALVDANGDFMADVDAAGNPIRTRLQSNLLKEHRRSYQMGTKITFLPDETSRLNLSLFTTPTQAQSVAVMNPVINPASQELDSALNEFHRNNTDVQLSGTKQMFDRAWRIDALLGYHRESYKHDSPYSNINNLNSVENFNSSLYDLEGIGGCKPVVVGDQVFDPCPVDAYHGGGFGMIERSNGSRMQADLKSTHLFSLGGRHELKYGARFELNEMTLRRRYSGPQGNRRAIQAFPDDVAQWSLFTLPQGSYPFQFAEDATPLTGAPYYQDELNATVKNNTWATFIQDSYSPVSNLTLNVGLRYERQKLFDFKNNPFATLDNVGLRAGAIYDPTKEGRAKLYTHYGRFFETVPLNLAARYFGGEGVAIDVRDRASCPTSPTGWLGSGGEAAGCQSAYAYAYNNGANYPVQPNLRGQYHDEIVAGGQWEPWDDFLLGLNVTHRWLGNVIEDGATRIEDFTFVLANPGNIPQKALDKADAEIAAKQMELAAATADVDKQRLEAEVGNLEARSRALKDLAVAPKPRRRYTGATLSLAKRFSQNFMMNAQYTYARLTGNYNGLFDPDNDYAAPNGNNSYDTPDLYLNKNGALANDRPHSARVMGNYQHQVGPGTLVGGLVFNAYSGVPRNYMANLAGAGQLVFLLPRGSAGRTPTVTQVDLKLSYRQALGNSLSMELFADLFNVLNTKTALLMDDNYTFDNATAIVGGTKDDLKVARNSSGQALSPNPNFGNGRVFQVPFHGRLGLRLLF